jgi:hypothetical protein
LQLDTNELKNILENLRISVFQDTVSSWMATKIVDFFLDGNNLPLLIPEIGEKTIHDLQLYAHTQKPLSKEQKHLLNQYGICVNGTFPDDLLDRLRQWTRIQYVKTFRSKSDDVRQSFFLKFILVMSYFEKVREIKLTNRKNDRNVRRISEELFIDSISLWKIINAMVQFEFVKKSKNLYTINVSKHHPWKRRPIDQTLKEFYQTFGGNRVLSFLQKVSHYQIAPDEWVDMLVLSDTSFEFDQAKSLGLIQVYKDGQKTYVQLVPESWYITKNSFPPIWDTKAIFVSAAFELFFPFHYEPFILLELLLFCSLKDSHYFLVFDIDIDKIKKNPKEGKVFYSTLITKSILVPDVVRYDLEILMN